MTSKAIQCDIFCDNSRKRFPFFRLPRKKISFFQTPFSDFRSGCPKKPSSSNGKLGPLDFIFFQTENLAGLNCTAILCLLSQNYWQGQHWTAVKKKRPQLFSNWVLFGTIGNRNMSVNMFPMRLCHFFCFLLSCSCSCRGWSQTDFFSPSDDWEENVSNISDNKKKLYQCLTNCWQSQCRRNVFWFQNWNMSPLIVLKWDCVAFSPFYFLSRTFPPARRFCPPWWGIWRGDNINVIIKVTISSLFANTMMIMVIKDFQTLGNPSKTT